MASACSSTGPCPHRSVFATSTSRNRCTTAGSYDARQPARSAPVSTPAWSAPLESRNGSRLKASMASATNPSRQARRAPSYCASRLLPAASPSATSRSSVAACSGLVTVSHALGSPPWGSHRAAEVGQCSRNSCSTRATVAAAVGSSWWPPRAYPIA